MKRPGWIIVFCGVFLTATVATAFALTLVATPVDTGEVGFFARWLGNATHYGWVAGVVVTAVFAFLRRKLISPLRNDITKPSGSSDVNSR